MKHNGVPALPVNAKFLGTIPNESSPENRLPVFVAFVNDPATIHYMDGTGGPFEEILKRHKKQGREIKIEDPHVFATLVERSGSYDLSEWGVELTTEMRNQVTRFLRQWRHPEDIILGKMT